jgi:hypothetical protein
VAGEEQDLLEMETIIILAEMDAEEMEEWEHILVSQDHRFIMLVEAGEVVQALAVMEGLVLLAGEME